MGQMRNIILGVVVLNNLFLQTKCNSDLQTRERKFTEAHNLASDITSIFYNLFDECINTNIQNKKLGITRQFIQDNLHRYVNYPARTTVGYAPKFTSNRKFFANLIATTAFKKMLEEDEDAIRRGMIKKMKFCDESVMDQQLLKDFYSKEVDHKRF